MSELADFTIGDRLIRPSLGQIESGDGFVRIEPRSMEVLMALAERPKEVYPKKELIDSVWGDAFVSDEVLTHAVWDLRKAFGDNANRPRFIQTIPKRGYRLIAPVERMRASAPQVVPQRRPWLYVLWGLVLLGLLAALLVSLRERQPGSSSADPSQPSTLFALVVGPGACAAGRHPAAKAESAAAPLSRRGRSYRADS